MKLRPHKVLGQHRHNGQVHALTLTTGEFAGIIFSYDSVNYEEENDVLRARFSYTVHATPEDKTEYDVEKFEKEIGDFLIELTFYGLEQDKLNGSSFNEISQKDS